MKDIGATVIITPKCNLKCTYCINGSGSDLVTCPGTKTEWKNADEIIECLKKISKVRNLRSIKLFGGEPMLKMGMVNELIERRSEFSPKDELTLIAFTTNAYYELTEEQALFWKNNHVIVNVSLDGPRELNNASRVAVDGKDVFGRVTRNLEVLKKVGCPFALVSVLDERILDYGFTVTSLSDYISQYTETYKIEPSYSITEHDRHNTKIGEINTLSKLLELQKEFIDEGFRRIKSLNVDNFIYENNFLRTISNLIYGAPKEYVCSASDLIGIFPDKKVYACYNLMTDDYKITDDITAIAPEKLDTALSNMKEKMRIERFPREYRDVEFYGDYCPLENNYKSFAYLYRKEMVERIKEHLLEIKPGTREHMALIGYLSMGYGGAYIANYA